ncbi:MAG: ABC transporter substrate-binding protein [Pseudomonadota bacterium]
MEERKKTYIAKQKAMLGQGGMSRRQFIMSMLAAGVALPAAMSMAGNVLAATPKKGGKFRHGTAYGSTTDSLDPATYENGFMAGTAGLYLNYLAAVDNDGELKPDLAESYESSDAKTWVFKLRKGIEFHNGKTMTADDVIASLNYHRGESSKSAAKGLMKQVKEMKKDDDHTLVFELEGANADFPFVVSDYHLGILPGTDGKIDPTSGIGTGGYAIEKFEAGVRTIGKRNPNYFKSNRAHFDEVEIISIIDVTARQNAIMSGDVDHIDRVDPKTVALLARAPTLNILETTGTQHYTFPMRLDTEPFGNADLRMALKLAIKRQELVDKILLGHGAIGNDHPISVSNQYHNGDLAQREYDPEKAAHHYKKSGHSGSISLSASDAAFAGAVDAAQLIKASAADAGITIDVVREPSDGYWSNVWNKKGWCACYWGGRPTEDWMFSAAYIDSTEWNDTAWKTTDAAKKFNGIVVQARAELDPAKRRTLYAECQQLVSDDGGAIVPMWANYIHASAKKVAHDEKVAGNWENDGNRAAERWWFNS